MLLLTRKEGEDILIFPAPDLNPEMTVAELFKDGPITIRLSHISRTQTRIGIDAPMALQIVRPELLKT